MADTTGETVWVLDIVGYDARGGNAQVFSSAERAMAACPDVIWSEPDAEGAMKELDPMFDTTDICVIYRQVVQ